MRILCGLLLLACAGCLDAATTDDMGLSGMDEGVDVGLPDLEKADLFGLLNCSALDKAEQMCKATNQTCVDQLRTMATPSAVQLDTQLQQCFHTACPLNGVCMPDGNGDYTAPCMQCVNNTLQSNSSACTPAGGMGCTACYNQAQACLADG
jgi:hypothetical protein